MHRLALVLAVSLIPASAAADGLAVLDLRFHKVPPALIRQIRETIQAALRQDGYDVMPEPAAVTMLRDAGIPPGCTIGPCLTRVKETLKVDRVVVGGVMSQGTSYDITLSLLETGGGSALSQVNKRCSVCTFMEVEKTIADATTHLHKQALVYLATRCSLTVRSRPPGANVLLDGLLAGQTPLTNVLSPGSHNVEVAAKGYSAASQAIHLAAGRGRVIDVTLIKQGEDGESVVTFDNNNHDNNLHNNHNRAGTGATRPGWLKWTVLGAGAVMGGIGGGLVALDGDETSDPRYLHDTSTAGITLLSLGGAAMITAAVIYLLDESGSTRRREVRASRARVLSVPRK